MNRFFRQSRSSAAGLFLPLVACLLLPTKAALAQEGPTPALPQAPAAGDLYMIERGCDKSFDVCRNRFANQANFGGFKNIPQLINPMPVES